MSTEVLPYTVKSHPVTGIYNGKFGTWLFLASEVMLFGALFSTYVLLRVTGASWPHHSETHLSWQIGGFNTLVLIVSSVTMVMAWAALKENKFDKARMFLIVTFLLAGLFIVVKLLFEYIPKIQHGMVPATNNFFGLYYTMTGLHALHIIGGMVVIGYFIGPGAALWRRDPEYYTNRIECTGLYWHFVDLVWIFLFPVLYLTQEQAMAQGHADISHHKKLYMAVFIALAVFTVITVAASTLTVSSGMHIAIAMIIAAVKASLVAWVFMHLKWDRMISIWWVLAICAVFFVVLMVLPILTVTDNPPQVEHSTWTAPPPSTATGHGH